jgi:hypothetical protein
MIRILATHGISANRKNAKIEWEKQGQLPSVSEMIHILKGRGITANRKKVERIFKKLDFKPTPEKRGAKPGVPRKLVHRALR